MKKITILLMAALLSGAALAQSQNMTNLVVFLRFADQTEITRPFSYFDNMFNNSAPDAESVYNFFLATTYGRLHFNTVYDLRQDSAHVVCVADTMPRGYYRHRTPTNPIGYLGDNPTIGISMREAQLIARAIRFLDQNHLVDSTINLDGNDDGIIDNISFIIRGDVDGPGKLLWPHMEFFPHDSIDGILTLNGKRVNTFNFEFEDSGNNFNTHVFCHEMGHSLGLPDLYHYFDYAHINPVSYYDIMSTNTGYCHQSVIYKNRILHCCDDPIRITHDGTYTLRSNGSSPSQNLYYIKSAIDTNQWYTFEYRCASDPCEYSIPYNGMLIGRWLDTADCTNIHGCGNAWFDNSTHYNTYNLFAPGAESDAVWSNHDSCLFCIATGQTSFGPATDPHPYLADGTPEASFEIYDIQDSGQTCTFSVRFLHTQGVGEADGGRVAVYPNPATDHIDIVLAGKAEQTACLYDLQGRLLRRQRLQGHGTMSLRGIPAGICMLRIGASVHRVVVK